MIVLAIDPGNTKCGLALVEKVSEIECNMLWSTIIPSADIIDTIKKALDISAFKTIILGDGTYSKQIANDIRDKFTSIGIIITNEKNSTLSAREKYWKYNPRKGWRKLLPVSMQVPPVDIDNYAALVLAEKVLLGGNG